MKSPKEGIKERGCPNRPSQDFCNIPFLLLESKRDDYSVVTLLARFLGLSTSVPFAMAV